MAMTAHATELQLAGRDITSRSQDEPDFVTPANFREAAIAAIRRGETRDTVFGGRIEPERAVCDKFKRENGLDDERPQIAVGGHAGAVQRARRHDHAGDVVSYPEDGVLRDDTPVGSPAQQRLQVLCDARNRIERACRTLSC
jgi:hypothetical protein